MNFQNRPVFMLSGSFLLIFTVQLTIFNAELVILRITIYSILDDYVSSLYHDTKDFSKLPESMYSLMHDLLQTHHHT